jgi:cytochrome P450
MGWQSPLDEEITLDQLDRDPFPIYRCLRAQAPVLRVKSLNRTLPTKAAHTKFVKDTPEVYNSDDPNTPMKRAFWAHTLMCKNGAEHRRERMAPAFSAKVIQNDWMPAYRNAARYYVARGQAILLGMLEDSDEQMMEWSQALIEGAGNFGWCDAPFARADRANEAIHALLDSLQARHRAAPNNSAFPAMLNADDPIAERQIYAIIKIAISGGMIEPSDANNTVLYGLLTNPDQLAQVKRQEDWSRAFEKRLRRVAHISASSHLVTQDTELCGYFIPKGDTVMTIQASANRDEELFENGEAFQVYRDSNPHRSFSNGPHNCQGTHVARRSIGEIMLSILFDRFPGMQIPDPSAVSWRRFDFRGPVLLPMLMQ